MGWEAIRPGGLKANHNSLRQASWLPSIPAFKRSFRFSGRFFYLLFQLQDTAIDLQEVIKPPMTNIHPTICNPAIKNASTKRILLRGMILPGAFQYRTTM